MNLRGTESMEPICIKNTPQIRIPWLHLLPKAFAAARQAAGWELIMP
jgi:hypothetical protein